MLQFNVGKHIYKPKCEQTLYEYVQSCYNGINVGKMDLKVDKIDKVKLQKWEKMGIDCTENKATSISTYTVLCNII